MSDLELILSGPTRRHLMALMTDYERAKFGKVREARPERNAAPLFTVAELAELAALETRGRGPDRVPLARRPKRRRIRLRNAA